MPFINASSMGTGNSTYIKKISPGGETEEAGEVWIGFLWLMVVWWTGAVDWDVYVEGAIEAGDPFIGFLWMKWLDELEHWTGK